MVSAAAMGSRLCSHRYRGNCANVVDTAGDAANGGRRDPRLERAGGGAANDDHNDDHFDAAGR